MNKVTRKSFIFLGTSSTQRLLTKQCCLLNIPTISKIRTIEHQTFLSRYRYYSTEPDSKETAPQNDATSTSQQEKSSSNGPTVETEELLNLRNEIKDLKSKVLRSLANEENARRIAKIDVENAKTYANTGFAKSMLEVADNIERAIKSVPLEAMKEDNKPLKMLLEGVELTQKEMHKIFQKHGIVQYGSVNEVADPALHETLTTVPVQNESEKSGTVAQVYRTGYKLHDRVIRAAQVVTRQEKLN